MSDPVLLAIVIDDPLAPRVLATCKALKLPLAEVSASASDIALVARARVEEVERTLQRCTLAGLLVDGGISETADRWLSAHVSSKLGAKPPAKKKSTS